MESLPPKLYRPKCEPFAHSFPKSCCTWDIALFVYDDNWDLLESKSKTRHKKQYSQNYYRYYSWQKLVEVFFLVH